MEVNLYNEIGQKVQSYQKIIENNLITIDTSKLSQGIYFLKIENKFHKIVKQ